MSQGLHQGIFDFSDGFDRPRPSQTDQAPLQPEPTTIYEATTAGGNMLSEMFNFHQSGISATPLRTSQISSGYGRLQRPPMGTAIASSWYGSTNRENSNTVGGLNGDSASVMQLYLMNPHEPASCPSPQTPNNIPQALPLHHDFINNPAAATLQGQGLSLSLSSPMQRFEMAKEEAPATLYYNNGTGHRNNIDPLQQLQGQQSQNTGQPFLQVGFNGQMGVMNILRHSKYAKATRELLEEFCSMSRAHHEVKGSRKGKRLRDSSSNPNNNPTSYSQFGGSSTGGASCSSSKDPTVPNLSASERFEHQRRKSSLLSMLDEVDRRYTHYCEQMQMVVNSFDAVMDSGAAKPYSGLAQKAMSRHFRCLKDGITAQLKHTCELLGDKDTGIASSITRGETPRLKILDRSLRQQRSINHMGMMEHETWRPQRGLPERSVNILRAWLFEHFLHPYPSDGDKHLLARQSGLTRNQVSNWFINARVRLWKPMVEEMYHEESKEEDDQEPQADETSSSSAAGNKNQYSHQLTALSTENPVSHAVGALPAPGMELPAMMNVTGMEAVQMVNYGSGMNNIGVSTQVRFGDPGDVSLTLGLQQSVNMPAAENNRFSLRDFNG